MPAPRNVLRSFLGGLTSSVSLFQIYYLLANFASPFAEKQVLVIERGQNQLKTLITSDQKFRFISTLLFLSYGVGTLFIFMDILMAESVLFLQLLAHQHQLGRIILQLTEKGFKYPFGRYFYLQTDHKLLERVLGEKSGISTKTSCFLSKSLGYLIICFRLYDRTCSW